MITGEHWATGHTKTVTVGLGIISAKTRKRAGIDLIWYQILAVQALYIILITN